MLHASATASYLLGIHASSLDHAYPQFPIHEAPQQLTLPEDVVHERVPNVRALLAMQLRYRAQVLPNAHGSRNTSTSTGTSCTLDPTADATTSATSASASTSAAGVGHRFRSR